MAKQRGDFVADLLFLPGRERQVRVEQITGKHFRIAGRVVPAVKRRLRQLVAAVELKVLRVLDDFDIGVDADLLPHLHDGPRDIVIARGIDRWWWPA